MRSAIRHIVLLAILAIPANGFAWTVAAHTCAAQPGGGDGTNLVSSGIDTSGATLIVLYSAAYIGSSAVSVSDSKSNTWTGLTNLADSQQSRLWYAYGATVGASHTFTISTADTTLFNGALCVMAVSGNLVGGDPIDAQNVNSNSSALTLTTGSVTPSLNNEIVITGFASAANNTAPAVDSGLTLLDSLTGTGRPLVGLAYITQGIAASINPTWTIDPAANNQANIASFKGPTTRRPMGVMVFP